MPLRLEIGPADLAKQQTLSVRRDTGVKAPLPLGDITTSVPQLLDTIQADMFRRAKETYDSRIKEVTRWEDVVPTSCPRTSPVIVQPISVSWTRHGP